MTPHSNCIRNGAQTGRRSRPGRCMQATAKRGRTTRGIWSLAQKYAFWLWAGRACGPVGPSACHTGKSTTGMHHEPACLHGPEVQANLVEWRLPTPKLGAVVDRRPTFALTLPTARRWVGPRTRPCNSRPRQWPASPARRSARRRRSRAPRRTEIRTSGWRPPPTRKNLSRLSTRTARRRSDPTRVDKPAELLHRKGNKNMSGGIA